MNHVIETPHAGKRTASSQMKSWNDTAARVEATWNLCEYLENAPDETQRCVTDPDYAKALFARLGHFYLEGDPDLEAGLDPIPVEGDFRIFEFDPVTKRDSLVTIVLPPKGKASSLRDRGDASDVFRCSWLPWLQ
jgi:hypothetical protein